MSNLDRINTIVVLMLENGSFDHKLGFLKSSTYNIDGLTGNETVPMDPTVPGSPRVQVSNTASYRGDFNLVQGDPKTFIDPAHDVGSVHDQLFGGSPDGKPINQGFFWSYQKQGKNTPQHAQNIVKCFSPGTLPVLTTLAQEFAVCDRWFSSVP